MLKGIPDGELLGEKYKDKRERSMRDAGYNKMQLGRPARSKEVK